MHRSKRHATCALSLLGALACGLVVGCAQHEAEPAFRASVLIDDRGISIPLPPPSLIDEPKQDVEVEGEVVGLAAPQGVSVVIIDNAGDAEAEIPLASDDGAFRASGLSIDLTDNCLELWLESADGEQGEHQQYRAVIDASGQGIDVIDGCD